MRWSTERSVALGFGVALAALLALAAIAYRTIDHLVQTDQRLSRTHDAFGELERTLGLVGDAETGARGFVLTGDQRHLAPYHTAVTSLDQHLRRLGELTAHDPPPQVELVELLQRRIDETLAILKETVETRVRLGGEGAWRVVLADKGKERMDPVRRLVEAMRTTQTETLRRYTAEQAAAVQQMIAALVIGGGFAFVLLALAGVLLRRDIERRKRAEEALTRANVRLASWVDDMDQRGREITLLGEMGDLLRSCRTATEAYSVIGDFGPRLFPGASGILGAVNSAKTLVEAVASWGSIPAGDRMFQPPACWALRRGRLYVIDDPTAGPLCSHVNPVVRAGYFCAPLTVQGEPLGVLHVQTTPDEWSRRATVPPHVKESQRQLALNVAQHTALAVANLRLQETLRGQALRDPLTNLFNRRHMVEALAREIRRAARASAPLGIIMLDIDHFKRFNDTYGHEAGDVLLRGVAEFLTSHVRGEDIACRYGGEEFTLILPGAPLQVSAQRAEQLRRGVQDLTVPYEGQTLGPVTLSFGVAVFPEHGESGDAVLRAADAALYRAKQEGRNRVMLAA